MAGARSSRLISSGAKASGTPRSVVESVALRLEALPPACTALARALSVANGTVAARVAGLDVASAVEAFEAPVGQVVDAILADGPERLSRGGQAVSGIALGGAPAAPRAAAPAPTGSP